MSIPMPGNLDMLAMLKSDPVFVRPYLPSDVDSIVSHADAVKAGMISVGGKTPAEAAGIRRGDKILAINGHPTDSWNKFNYQLTVLGDILKSKKTAKDLAGAHRQPRLPS